MLIKLGVLLLVVSMLWLRLALKKRKVVARPPLTPNLQDPPGIGVVLCCKGMPPHFQSCIYSQLDLTRVYSGEMEFTFVVESYEDSAYRELVSMLEERKDITGKVVVAGKSAHMGQKLFNLMNGIFETSPNLDILLFMDNDAKVNPETLNQAIARAQSGELVTSYVYEYPAPNSSLATYAAIAYRMLNMLAFAESSVPFVWGGFMCIPKTFFSENIGRILDVWADGGYSDDNLLSRVALYNGVPVYAPPTALLHSELNISFFWYKRFLFRQYFALKSYFCSKDGRENYMILFMIISIVWLFWIPFIVFVVCSFCAIPLLFVNDAVKLPGLLTLGVWACFCFLNVVLHSLLSTFESLVRHHNSPIACAGLSHSALRTTLGLVLHVFIMPVVCLNVLFSSSVVWGGITYKLKKGRIVNVTHPSGVSRTPQESMIALLKARKQSGL